MSKFSITEIENKLVLYTEAKKRHDTGMMDGIRECLVAGNVKIIDDVRGVTWSWIEKTDTKITTSKDAVGGCGGNCSCDKEVVSMPSTRLLQKHYSPMIIRKYTRLGFPLYVHLICDSNLNDLDSVVHDALDDFEEADEITRSSIQSLRDFTGELTERINKHFNAKNRGCVESIGVIFYVDKMLISSLHGDCMNHESCRQELYDGLNLMTKI